MKLDMHQVQGRLIDLMEKMTDKSLHYSSLNMPLTELGVDSLMALELAVYLEREFGVRLTENELSGIQCPQDILTIMQNKGE